MKYVKFIDHGGNLKTREVIESTLRYGGERGINYDSMHKRQRIWDALDKNADSDGVLLEDADFDLLVSLVRVTPFNVASRELVSIVAELLGSKAP